MILNLAFHALVTLVASASMVAATQPSIKSHPQSVGASLITTGILTFLMLLSQLHRLYRQGRSLYFDSLWGALDILSCLCLLVAVGSHFAGEGPEQRLELTGAVLSSRWTPLAVYTRNPYER